MGLTASLMSNVEVVTNTETTYDGRIALRDPADTYWFEVDPKTVALRYQVVSNPSASIRLKANAHVVSRGNDCMGTPDGKGGIIIQLKDVKVMPPTPESNSCIDKDDWLILSDVIESGNEFSRKLLPEVMPHWDLGRTPSEEDMKHSLFSSTGDIDGVKNVCMKRARLASSILHIRAESPIEKSNAEALLDNRMKLTNPLQ